MSDFITVLLLLAITLGFGSVFVAILKDARDRGQARANWMLYHTDPDAFHRKFPNTLRPRAPERTEEE